MNIRLFDPSTPATEGESKPLSRVIQDWLGLLVREINKLPSKTDVSAASMPVGSIAGYFGNTDPVGWFIIDGRTLSRTTYAALYRVPGVPFGAGDGSTTFTLPNASGLTLIGAGQGSGLTNRVLGTTVGEETHVLTTGEMPVHNHAITDPGHSHTLAHILLPNGGSSAWTGVSTSSGGGLEGTSSSTTGITIQNAGSGGAHNNMQPSLVANWIIKH